MKKRIKLISLSIASLMLLLAGCGNGGESDSSKNSKEKAKKDYDLFIYNTDYDISESFEKMCNEYGARSGVTVKCLTEDPDDEDSANQLQNYMNSGTPPSIFTINDMEGLKKWQSSGNVLDFSNATQEEFKNVANSIPLSLRLSSNTVDSFGVPYTIDGYGYLVDPKMLSSLFGGDKYRSVLSDLKECQYDEFESFINALNVYISSGQVYEIKLNGKPYNFLETRGELAENLNGVFSYPAGEPKQTGSYMINVALASVFNSAADANIADDKKIDMIKNPMIKLAQALELRTSCVSGKNGMISRGLDLVDTTINSYNQSIKNFVSGKSLFLIEGTTSYNTILGLNQALAKRLVFIPIKLPITSQDISSSITQKKFNLSIPVYSPRYYAINAKAPEKEQQLAQDFLVWLETSDLAEKYVIQEFGYIPYYIKESSAIDNPISRSMIEYLSSENILPKSCEGAPDKWCDDTVAKHIIDQYFTKPVWSYSDHEEIADYAIRKWKEMKTN